MLHEPSELPSVRSMSITASLARLAAHGLGLSVLLLASCSNSSGDRGDPEGDGGRSPSDSDGGAGGGDRSAGGAAGAIVGAGGRSVGGAPGGSSSGGADGGALGGFDAGSGDRDGSMLCVSASSGSAGAPALLWARGAGAATEEQGTAIAGTPDRGAVVAGFYNAGLVFGWGEPTETTLPGTDRWSAFVAKYRADGALGWAARHEAPGAARGVTVLQDGSAVVVGQSYMAVLVAKYGPDGSPMWSKPMSGTRQQVAYAVSAFEDDSIAIAGNFNQTVTFGAGEAGEVTLQSRGMQGPFDWNHDVFVAKLGADGSLAWARRAGGEENDQTLVGVAAAKDGSTFVTGGFRYSATFGEEDPTATTLETPTYSDVFLAKYGADGALAWASGARGPNCCINASSGVAVAALPDGSAVVTGRFHGTVTFGPGEPKETTLVHEGSLEGMFVAKYDPSGRIEWVGQSGGNGGTEGRAVAALGDGSFVVAGWLDGAAVFGTGEPNETALRSDCGRRGFLAKFAADGSLLWARASSSGNGVAVLSDGSTAVAGVYHQDLTLDDGTLLPAASPNGDVFVGRFSP